MPKNKNKPKKVEDAVNPIIFGCNEMAKELLDLCCTEKVTNALREQCMDKADLNRKRRLKVLPLTIAAHEKLGHPPVSLYGPYGTNINEHLCNSYVYPGPTCKIRKLSERATRFLLSLGAPTKDIRMDYREHLYQSALNSPEETVMDSIAGNFYEELLELPINGHTEYIYLIASTEMCLILHRRKPKVGENEYFNIPIHPNLRDRELKGATVEYDENYNNWETGNLFDVEALLANLWVAETLRTCEVCSEPDYSRHAADKPVILAGKKPLKHSVAYRYIHITDEKWKNYESASQCVREQKNFNVASWFVRAHYARMHGKAVLVKAHYAYRRKGAVNGTAPVDYIV